MNSRRVVVTGIGAISCLGHSVEETWKALIEGKCGIGPVTRFDTSAYRTHIAGEVRNFDPTRYMSEKEARRLDDFCLYAIAAGDEALKDALAKLKLNDETLNCLDLIAENGRFAEMAQILDAFKHIYYAKHGITEVEVGTVKALSVAQDNKLKANLEKMLSSKVVVKYQIKPELLGGLVIKFNSNMIDDSLKSKLNRLELVMKGGQ